MTKTTTNESRRSGWKRRAWLVLGIVTFVGSFQQVYLKWLYPVFGYYGFEHSHPKMGYLLLAWGLSIGPAWWMPIKLTRPSQLVYWVLYLSVFFPSSRFTRRQFHCELTSGFSAVWRQGSCFGCW